MGASGTFGTLRYARLAVLTAMASGAIACSHAQRNVEAQGGPNPANVHTVSVSFEYDFTKSPACGEKVAKKTCIKQFDVYDVSSGKYKLFSIPPPADATGVTKVSGQSAPRGFEPGTHFLAVTAEDASGIESNVEAAKTTVEIKAKTTGEPNGNSGPK